MACGGHEDKKRNPFTGGSYAVYLRKSNSINLPLWQTIRRLLMIGAGLYKE